MAITIKALSAETEADFFDFFDNRAFSDGSPFAPCYCNCFHLTPAQVQGEIMPRSGELGEGMEGVRLALRESAEKLIHQGVMQGYLAYEEGVAIGWCNANDRQHYIRVGSFQPWERKEGDCYITPGEEGKVKSIACFEIAPGHRGKGIAKALLQRVCEDAKAAGYALVDVYPQESEAFSTLDFNGPIAMYRNAGFEETGRQGKTIIMQKKL